MKPYNTSHKCNHVYEGKYDVTYKYSKTATRQQVKKEIIEGIQEHIEGIWEDYEDMLEEDIMMWGENSMMIFNFQN